MQKPKSRGLALKHRPNSSNQLLPSRLQHNIQLRRSPNHSPIRPSNPLRRSNQPHLLSRGSQNLPPKPTRPIRIIHHNQPPSPLQRPSQPIPVKRINRPRIKNLDRSLPSQLLSHRQSIIHQMTNSNDGNVLPNPMHPTNPQRNRLQISVVHILTNTQRSNRTKENHRIIIPNRSSQQPISITRSGRDYSLHTHMSKHAIRLIRMLSPPSSPPPSSRQQISNRHTGLPTTHQPKLISLIGDLLKNQQQQKGNLKLDHRTPTSHSRPGGEVGEPLLGQRHLQDALRTEALQKPSSNIGQCEVHVLTKHKDRRITIHLVPKRPIQRLQIRQLRHD
jgi:hypothetical protein